MRTGLRIGQSTSARYSHDNQKKQAYLKQQGINTSSRIVWRESITRRTYICTCYYGTYLPENF